MVDVVLNHHVIIEPGLHWIRGVLIASVIVLSLIEDGICLKIEDRMVDVF